MIRKLFGNTLRSMRWDMRRLWVRAKSPCYTRILRGDELPSTLHFGCGKRRIAGWLNVDLKGSDIDVDLASGRLPFASNRFECAVSEHVVEHLDLNDELVPLLKELKRVLVQGGELWLSTPDMDAICRRYVAGLAEDLVRDRKSRYPEFTLRGAPGSQILNVLFHQYGQHKNLFDYDILRWALEQAGFAKIRRRDGAEFRARFAELPDRRDEYQSIYVSATAS